MQHLDVTALLDTLRAQGLTQEADGDDLLVSGSELPEEVRTSLAERKPELLAYLGFHKQADELLLAMLGRLTDHFGGRAIPDMPEHVAEAYATMAQAHDQRDRGAFEEALAAFEAAWARALQA